MGYQFRGGENLVDYSDEMYFKCSLQTHEFLDYSILESHV
jgi:hypothetical protein